MSKWIPLMMVAALALFSGCKKSEPAKAEPPAVDTAAALPAPPELEPVDAVFADSAPVDPEAQPAPAATPAKAAPAKSTTTPATPAAQPAAKPVAQASGKTAPKPAASATVSSGLSPNGAYTLQVGIFNNEGQANRTADKLKAQGFPAYVTRVQDPKPSMPGTYYRVRVGSFASSQAARAYGETNLAPAGVDYWADLKGRDTQAVQQVFKPKPAAPTPTPSAAPAPKPVESAPAAANATPTPAPTPTPVPAAEPVPAKQDTKPATSLPDW